MKHKIVWITDIHLNVADDSTVDRFLQRVAEEDADTILLTGDVAESPEVVPNLLRLEESVQRPIYFVLGNHDYYFSSIARMRREMKLLCRASPHLTYMSDEEVIGLTDDIALVGHDGWADGRYGDYERSMVMMHDYTLIEELAGSGLAND